MDLSECAPLDLPEQKLPCYSKEEEDKKEEALPSSSNPPINNSQSTYDSEDCSEDDWNICDCEGDEALRLKKQNYFKKFEDYKDGDSFYAIYKESIKELEDLKKEVEKYKKIELLQGEEEQEANVECDETLKYLKEAKTPALNCATVDKYFFDKNLVHKFGTSSLLRMRLGFDPFSGYWRIYIHKPNAEFKPSVVYINYHELNEFIQLIEDLVQKIEQGNVNGTPFLQPEDITTWKTEKCDNAEYWTKDSFTLEAQNVRVKVCWNYGRHNLILNNPVPSSNIENFYGPKIPVPVKDAKDLINIINEIRKKCPDYDIMVDN